MAGIVHTYQTYTIDQRPDIEPKPRIMIPIRLFLLCFMLMFAGATTVAPASAHEYYLMPDNFSPAAGKQVAVRHLLGQRFKGNELPWITRWNIRSEQWQNGSKKEIAGIDGDRPALKATIEKPGLAIFLHQSNIDQLTFKTWEKFTKYVKKEGIDDILQRHQDAGKPKQGVKELYSRYAKTLVDIGGKSQGLDQPTGLKIELVALRHPSTLKAAEPMPVQVLFDGSPLPNVTVKVFAGIGTEAATKIKSGPDGKAHIPPLGPGPYLLNAIKMTEVVATGKIAQGAHWESFWASLTFERKE